MAASVLSVGMLVGESRAATAANEVTVVLVEEPDTLDPCELTKRNTGFVIRENIIETLTEIDPLSGEVLPRLAESWERVDATTWRFNLRPGVKFHDGTPLDAEVAVRAFNRMMNPNISCSNRVLYFENVAATVKAADDLTFEITTPNPTPIMPLLMTMFGVEAPSTDPDGLVRDPVGTGPYKLVEWVSGQRIEVERNADYWGEQPQVERASYIFREDPTVRAAMVAAGEADITLSIAPQDATNPETDFSYLNSETMTIRFDLGKEPLNDIRVRKAINHAIDREAMLGTVYSPRWVLAKNFVMPTIAGYNDDVVVYDYDPDLARQLVEEARADGVDVDKEILLIASNTPPGGFEGLTVMTEMMNDVGLNVRLQIVESADYYSFVYKPYASGQPVHLLVDLHDNNSGDAGITLANKYASSGGTSKLDDPEVDKLIADGLAAEGAERVALFKQAFARIRELAPDVILYHQAADTRVGSRIVFRPTAATNAELQLSQITLK